MSEGEAHHEEETNPAKRSRWDRVKAIGRWVLLGLGVAAVVGLVVDAGADAVWNTLVRAGVWLPLVMLCEIGFVGMDVVSLRLMYGERARRVPARVWLRSGMMAYGIDDPAPGRSRRW